MPPKQPTRTARWMNAASECEVALAAVVEAAEALGHAASALYEVQQEYQTWLENLPENLQGSPLGDKLERVCDLDIESITSDPLSDWGTTEDTIQEAVGIDLPLGFGRD